MITAVPVHDAGAHCFRLSLPEGEVRLDYRPLTPGWVDFHHTFTPASLRGRGLAAQVVAAGLDWAHAEGLRVVASCSYVAAVLAQRTRGG
jgi:predicted GNAT family acetyltransferase